MSNTQNMNMPQPNLNDTIKTDIPNIATDLQSIDTEFGQRGINVVWYGADPTGASDSTTAIQNAINAATGKSPVLLPSGNYKVSSPITVPSQTHIIGAGYDVTIIKFSGTSGACFAGTDVSNITMQDLTVYSTVGNTTGTATGISFTITNNPDIFNINFIRVHVNNFAGNGFYVQHQIVSSYTNCEAQNCGLNGFYTTYSTSTSYISCYGNNNKQAGYYIDNATYLNFSATAADSNGCGYYVTNCSGSNFSGCGSESSVNNSSTYDGNGWYLYYSHGVTLNGCFSYNEANNGVEVSSGCTDIAIIGFSENTDSGAIGHSCIQVDSSAPANSVMVIPPPKYSHGPNYAAGTTFAPMSQNNITTPAVNPPVSGTVYQNVTAAYQNIYLPVYATTTGTAGSIVVSLGSTSTPSALYTRYVSGSATSSIPEVITLRIPPGWHYSFTGTSITFKNTSIVGE